MRPTQVETTRVDTPSSPLAFYRARGAAEPAGVGAAPLVLGHSLGSDRHMWDWTVELLPSDLDLILWEQPGHGESQLLREQSPSASDTVEAVHAGLDDLGIRSAFFAGLSLGGLTTLAYAQQYPETVRAFMVLDSGPVTGEPGPWFEKADQVLSRGMEPLADGTMERWFTADFASGVGRPVVEQIRRIFVSTAPEGYAQCCRILGNTDLRAAVRLATAPAYVLTGAEDAGVTPQGAEELLESLPDPRGLVIVPAAKHLTAVQEPELVAASLVNMVLNP